MNIVGEDESIEAEELTEALAERSLGTSRGRVDLWPLPYSTHPDDKAVDEHTDKVVPSRRHTRFDERR